MGSTRFRPLGRLLSFISRLQRDRRGVTAVEFALVAPIALLLLFGEFTLTQAMSIKRKLTITAHTIGDLVAQQADVSASLTTSLTTLLNASSEVIAPYSNANLSMVVSELYTDANGNTTVIWSGAFNGTALTQGAKFVLPAGLAQNSTYLIYSVGTYTYTPILGQSVFGSTINFNSQFYINPRNYACVKNTNLQAC